MDTIAHVSTPSADGAALTVWQEAPPGAGMSQILMMAAIFAIFYFLLIRPQQKEAKAQQELLGALQKGDRVATASGLHGTVWEVRDLEVVLEIAERVRVTVDKPSVKRKVGPEVVGVKGS